MVKVCQEYNSILYGLNDDMAATGKLEQEQLAKLADLGELQGKLDSDWAEQLVFTLVFEVMFGFT